MNTAKMNITIFNSNYGVMDGENGAPSMNWANIQTVGDFAEKGNKVGCELSKMAVSTDNHFALSKRLSAELLAAKAPLNVIGHMGMGVAQGKSVFLLKDFEFPKA